MLEINTDETSLTCNALGQLYVKVAAEEDNGLFIGGDGKIHTRKGKQGGTQGGGGTNNTPGNMIEGEYERGISILRCNKYVTRINIVDGDIPGVVCIDDIVEHMLL